MRLALCCLTVTAAVSDRIVLDEPTNNLDLESVSILTNVIRDYKGTLIVISHDLVFLKQIGIPRFFALDTLTNSYLLH